MSEKLNAVTSEEIQSLAAELFAPDRALVTTVKP
jgi:predicted Zn-dependent peptidase